MEQERWLPVLGYEDRYEVSDLGRVRNIKKRRGTRVGRLLTPCLEPEPVAYMVVNLGYADGRVRRKTWRVHQLVASAFLGAEPDRQVNHLDGDKTNNRLVNLEWASRSENQRHSARTGLRPTGAAVRGAKLSADDVRTIRRRCAAGELQRVVGADFGLDQRYVSAIVLRRKWAHLT